MAFAIRKPDTAFQTAKAQGQKRPRKEDGKHLAWLRTLPCVITGTRPVEAAHIKFGSALWAKPEGSMGMKPDDKWALPLCVAKHREQHDENEKLFWARHGLDPLQIAAALYGVTGDDEQAFVILTQAWATVAAFARPAQEEAET